MAEGRPKREEEEGPREASEAATGPHRQQQGDEVGRSATEQEVLQSTADQTETAKSSPPDKTVQIKLMLNYAS